jgi:hypothetical protein
LGRRINYCALLPKIEKFGISKLAERGELVRRKEQREICRQLARQRRTSVTSPIDHQAEHAKHHYVYALVTIGAEYSKNTVKRQIICVGVPEARVKTPKKTGFSLLY